MSVDPCSVKSNFIPAPERDFYETNPNFDTDHESGSREAVLSSRTPEEVAESWENGFTDPGAHDGDNFRYLVHAFQGPLGNITQKLVLLEQPAEGNNIVDGLNSVFDLERQPLRIGERDLISASVIDHNHSHTFGDAGLILSTPYTNVLDTFGEDAATDFRDPKKVITSSKRIVCSVDELMEHSDNEEWNEVRLLGTTDDGPVEVIGFFVKVSESGEVLDPFTANQLKEHSAIHGLPLIQIVERKKRYPLEDLPPTVYKSIESTTDASGNHKSIEVPYMISVNREGLRYNFNFQNGNFSVVDDERRSHNMTYSQFTYALNLIRKELDPAEYDSIKDVIDKLENQFFEYEQERSAIYSGSLALSAIK